MVVSAVLVLVWSVLFVAALRGARRTRRLAPVVARPSAQVILLCPARDEVEVIDACLDGLLGQGLEQVVVVDDGSQDGTRGRLAARVEAGRLRVVDAPPPPPGARGKPAALAHAVETVVASGADAPRWLLFVDADVRLQPGAVAALVDEAEAQGWDLLSAHPRQRLESLAEEVAMPAIGSLVLLAHPPARVSAERPFANGQLMLVRRSVYEAAGGHRAVQGEILEDVRLAEQIARVGGRIACVDGSELAATRMYSGLRELWPGWEKNLYLLLGGRLGPVVGRLALALALAWAGPIAALTAGAWGLVAWVYVMILQGLLRMRGGAAPWGAVFAPVGAGLATAVAASSAWKHIGGGVLSWKGRDYGGEG